MKQEQNKMGTKPVKVLLLTMGLPMILSMVVQAFLQHCGQLFCQRHRREGADEAVHAPDPGLSHPDADGCSGGGNWNWRQRLDLQYLGMNNRGKGQPAGRQRDFFLVSAPTASFSSSVCS